jgi:uncharacterized protein (DUF1501 family)
MFTITGKRHRLCNGVSRRDVLRIGSLGLAGLALPDLLRLRAASAASGKRASNLIMIHMSGGPSHVDTWDPKPDAPADIRGEFKAIPTNVDGIQLCELFPLQAKMMDRFAIIRSITNAREEHASSHLCCGYWNTERETTGDHPSIGAVLTRERGQRDPLVPAFVSLRGYNRDMGLGAAYLGGDCEPLVSSGPGLQDLSLGRQMDLGRFTARRQLLERLDHVRATIEGSPSLDSQDAFIQRALTIVSSTKTRDALDFKKEDEKTRKRYGAHTSFLVARRLIEAGARCVALETGGWDTHSDNFRSLRTMLPQTDQAISALVQDLWDRGLYEDTVVIMWGEFGRTPKVNGSAGRDHWPRVMSALLAGGGMKMGQVVGATDPQASVAAERQVSVRDVVATLYQALGIDPHLQYMDFGNRPIALVHDGTPISELVG